MGICMCKHTYKKEGERVCETENHNYYLQERESVRQRTTTITGFIWFIFMKDLTSERQLTLLLFPGSGPAAK
uniref:Uncharacterized protein n=1 Tax=Solanum tuberosum TaxID=4113 RepID=M1AB22_SOLTU